MLLSGQRHQQQHLSQERYLTVSVHKKKNIDEAEPISPVWSRYRSTHLSKLSSIGEELDAEQRLNLRGFLSTDQYSVFPLI